MRPRRRVVCALLLTVALVPVGPVPSATAASSHRDKAMVDVRKPRYIGYGKRLKAYHFRVTGRWLAACGGRFCWPSYYPGGDNEIGTNDAVRIRFSDAVQFKKFRVRSWDYCGVKRYDKAKRFTSGSFEDAYAGVDDKVFPGWTQRTWNGETTYSGNCKSSAMPTSSYGAGGSGGSGGVTYWADLRARRFAFDVWVNPAPSRGKCYDRLYVKGGYTHTWGTTGLSWSFGYPWGVGVGPVSGTDDFTVYQGNDGAAQRDLVSPRLCRR
jgi:hypothetical protein